MPKKQKLYKYRCLELLCKAVVRQDKWNDHCKKKHSWKVKNNFEIKYKIVEVKPADSLKWLPYLEKNDSPPSLEGKETASVAEKCEASTSKNDACDGSSRSGTGISTIGIEESLVCMPPAKRLHLENKSTTPKVHDESPSTSIALNNICGVVFSLKSQESIEIEESIRSILYDDPKDPAKFSNIKLTSKDIKAGLKLESCKIDLSHQFPSNNNRKFSPEWKQCKLPDGTIKERMWLVYSKSNDSVYCLHCLLFALPHQQSPWSSGKGHRCWQKGNALRDIEAHESSKNHIACQVTRLQWISGNVANASLKTMQDKQIQHHQEVLNVIIDCCRFLIEEMLAFRKNDVVEGKLPKLFQLLSKYNPDARVYYEKIKKGRYNKKKLASNFLSYTNIFDLVSIMCTIVIKKIVVTVNESRKYSIIIDSTQDVSKKEVTTLIIRYVDQSDDKLRPLERLIAVFSTSSATGQNLKDNVFDKLSQLGLNKKQIIGQSMDGAGNMSGPFVGLKTLVLKECETAFYVWCSSHRFALVIEKSLSFCPKMRDFFFILEELYRLFNSGYKRHSVFVEEMAQQATSSGKKMRLKRVQTTRWSNVESLCEFYKWDCTVISEELNTFSDIYFATHENISVEDFNKDETAKVAKRNASEDLEANVSTDKIKDMWVTKGFIKPYRCLNNFSCFATLKIAYITLLSLAVTSCSAERAMSRVRIIKNRLRSSMSDTWLSNLMILSSEKDVFSSISNEEIIDRFACSSTGRKRLLVGL
ncbi:hypothetical protein JTE90_014013 [Oedothorax gibbosus]|uniref:DUF4371 domain-containing protein n=1 Tax=Oedothorax gibbosus TaxID=931172 RepID=A0AAV6U423_9ARAC|nr:hypothetical protein JTE90_014013 [Oedothorax gibbosus]